MIEIKISMIPFGDKKNEILLRTITVGNLLKKKDGKTLYSIKVNNVTQETVLHKREEGLFKLLWIVFKKLTGAYIE